MNALARALFGLAGRLSGGGDLYRHDYDLRAETYELAETRPLTRRASEEFMEGLKVSPGSRCLDLGCGTAHSALLLARAAGPSGSVDACDISAGMLAVAKSRAASADCHVTFTRAGMTGFLESRPPASADLASALWSAEYCRPGPLLRLCARALTPGGRAAMLVSTAESLSELQRAVTPVLLRRPGFIRRFPPINFPPGPAAFRAAAERGGLAVERLKERELAHTFKDAASVVEWLRSSGPAAGLTAALKPERLDEFFDAVAREIERRSGLTVTFRYLEFVGRK
ncbi:MAG: type 11 methyltransferase [Elusimicrobia bacterium]|nr:MAG: type 11 methyltransferase [Elusimicrobiota bacterium]KAF0155804.1 MAG: type 11 methyltransferase [Elusimicrobiota bacterium]